MSNNKEKGGSKKGASSSAGMLPVANAPTSKDGSRLPVAKGHKQKGAGTVIIAKAPVITADGIILKVRTLSINY